MWERVSPTEIIGRVGEVPTIRIDLVAPPIILAGQNGNVDVVVTLLGPTAERSRRRRAGAEYWLHRCRGHVGVRVGNGSCQHLHRG